MKQIRKNMRRIRICLCLLFVLLTAYGMFCISTYGNRWFSSSYNRFARAQKSNVIPGDILDRNGLILATSEGEKRVYNADSQVRRAVVHAVGDPQANVHNGAEAFLGTYLYGFHMSYLERVGYALRGETRHGDQVTLTIDGQLAAYIDSIFPSGKAGAVAVMNYKSGEVLTEQSFPNFDPERITSLVKTDAQKPFYNRAVQGLYAPGSTFKIVTAASALDHFSDALTRSYQCTGQLMLGDRLITDAGTDLEAGKITQHGQLNMKNAFQVSCNNTFAQIALMLGDPALRKTAEKFGFNDNFLFRDLVVENSSYPTENRNEGEIAWTGAGQSALTATPLHMCMITAAVANDGVMMEPQMVISAVSQSGHVRTAYEPRVYRRVMSPENAKILQEYMRAVVTGGTGSAASIAGVKVCGKTGSAELDNQENTNAWFVGYLDEDTSPYAIAIIVEDAGGGGSISAPLAKKIFSWMLDNGY